MKTSNTTKQTATNCKAIAAAVHNATAKYADGQRALCAALIGASIKAVDNGDSGIQAFREAVLAEREAHDCKNIRHYYGTIAGRVTYLTRLDPTTVKTLSGMIAQTDALHALEIKAHDVRMAKEKADALQAEKEAKEKAEREEKEAQRLQAIADKQNDEAAKAQAEAAAKAAKQAKEAADAASKTVATVTKQADAVAAKVEKIEAKAAPKTVTADSNQDKPRTTAAPKIPVAQATDLGESIQSTIDQVEQLAAEWSTLQAVICSKAKVSAQSLTKLSGRINALAASLSKMQEDFTSK